MRGQPSVKHRYFSYLRVLLVFLNPNNFAFFLAKEFSAKINNGIFYLWNALECEGHFIGCWKYYQYKVQNHEVRRLQNLYNVYKYLSQY